VWLRAIVIGACAAIAADHIHSLIRLLNHHHDLVRRENESSRRRIDNRCHDANSRPSYSRSLSPPQETTSAVDLNNNNKRR